MKTKTTDRYGRSVAEVLKGSTSEIKEGVRHGNDLIRLPGGFP